LSQARVGARPRATAIGARATANGALWGDRARCTRASRDRCSRKGIHIGGNNRGCHRAFRKGRRQLRHVRVEVHMPGFNTIFRE